MWVVSVCLLPNKEKRNEKKEKRKTKKLKKQL